MIDIHCHLLPGIDDGPTSWEEALSLARLFAEAGVRRIVITPHFIPGVYYWTREKGEALQRELKERMRQEGVEIETYLAAEVGIFPELLEWIGEGKVPLMPTGRHLLLEAPMYGSETIVRDMAFATLSVDITPIYAHPERSPFFAEPALGRDIVASEGELQVDAGSLVGTWGSEIKRVSMDLIDRGLVRYVASDSHGPSRRDPGEFVLAAEMVEETWGIEAREVLFHENPLALLPPFHAVERGNGRDRR